MKKGDKVKVVGHDKTRQAHGWNIYMDRIKTGTVEGIYGDRARVKLCGGDTWSYHPDDLEVIPAKSSRVARILTEKIMVNGVKCRKITGFEGILRREELPEKYLSKRLYFCMDSHRMTAHYPKNGDCGYAIGFGIGTVFNEEEYQEMLLWLRRAGSRLAKIREQEKEAWQGKQEDEI